LEPITTPTVTGAPGAAVWAGDVGLAVGGVVVMECAFKAGRLFIAGESLECGQVILSVAALAPASMLSFCLSSKLHAHPKRF